MKTQLFKLSAVAIVVVALLSLGFFISCKDDNSLSGEKNISSKSNSTNSQNPFEVVGVTHNEILNDFPNNVSLDNYTLNDIYSYNLEKGHLDNSISSDTFSLQIFSISKFMLHYTLSEEDLIYSSTEDQVVSYYMGRVKEIFVEMINENKEMTPKEFSERINIIEDELIALNLHDKDDIYDKELNKYSVLLSSLSVARHSYAFWYDAYHNENNPWHNIMLSRINEIGAKSAFGDFFREVGNALVSAAKAVAAVVAFVPADIGGALYHGYIGSSPVFLPDDNGENVVIHTPGYSVPMMIAGGAGTSMSVLRWGFDF